jgi:ABC-type uncharacterized transport system permease subunit
MNDATNAPAGAVSGPRIPWRRMAIVQLVAGAVVAFASVLFLFEFGLQALPLALLAAVLVTVLAALPPVLAAWVAHRTAIRSSRGRRREVVAVVVGALAGSLVPLLVFSLVFGLGARDGLIFSGIVAVASAIGFAIWVFVAWRTKPGERSLN